MGTDVFYVIVNGRGKYLAFDSEGFGYWTTFKNARHFTNKLDAFNVGAMYSAKSIRRVTITEEEETIN